MPCRGRGVQAGIGLRRVAQRGSDLYDHGVGHGQGVAAACVAAVACVGGGARWNAGGEDGRNNERGRLEREGEKEQTGEDKIYRGCFANICHRGNTWHATLASDACLVCLGPQTKHLADFRDLDA